MRWIALALASTLLCGCETTAERSAQLEAQAKRNGTALATSTPHLTQIATPSKQLTVVSKSLVNGAEGKAVVLSVRNRSGTALQGAPVLVTVRDSHAASVYTNATPGLSTTLVHLPLIAAHATAPWIDDQVTAQGTPASVTAVVGEGQPVTGTLPKLSLTGTHLVEEGSGTAAEGNLVNQSPATEHEVVIDAIASSGGRIVAAGRAVLPEVTAGSSTPFQLFFTGNPKGARLQLSAAPASGG